MFQLKIRCDVIQMEQSKQLKQPEMWISNHLNFCYAHPADGTSLSHWLWKQLWYVKANISHIACMHMLYVPVFLTFGKATFSVCCLLRSMVCQGSQAEMTLVLLSQFPTPQAQQNFTQFTVASRTCVKFYSWNLRSRITGFNWFCTCKAEVCLSVFCHSAWSSSLLFRYLWAPNVYMGVLKLIDCLSGCQGYWKAIPWVPLFIFYQSLFIIHGFLCSWITFVFHKA